MIEKCALKQLLLASNSFVRCDNSGRFATVFYQKFLNKAPRIRPLFFSTDFDQPRKLLRAMVMLMVNKRVENLDLRHHIESVAERIIVTVTTSSRDFLFFG